MLVEAGIIDDLQRTAALGEQRQFGGKIGSILINMRMVDENSICEVLEKQLGQKCVSLKDKNIPLSVLSALKPNEAMKYHVLPLDLDRKTLTIATSDPNDLGMLDDLSFMLGLNIKPVLALEYEIKKAIRMYYE